MRTAWAGATFALFVATIGWACGDKLVALGGGVPFDRIRMSQHPSTVILYLNPERHLQAVNADIRLDKALTRAGHNVRTVATRADLDRAMREAGADIVLMDWADAFALNAKLTDKLPTLPVVYGGAGPAELSSANARSTCVVEASKRKSAQLVRAVEHVIEDREKGLTVDCAKIGGRGVT
jgi:hypothetical protein